MYKYTLVQLIIADYRKEVFNLLNEKLDGHIITYCGKNHIEPGLTTKVDAKNNVKYVENKFLFNGKIIYQKNVIVPSIKSEKLILELNPRILSNWIILFARKILSKKTVLWGHAWGRNGKNSKSEPIRKIMRNMAQTILVYTKKQKDELQKIENLKIIAAPNALYKKKSMRPVANENRKNLIYVGRLVQSKKVDVAIRGFSKLLKKYPDAIFDIIGDGPEKNYLLSLSSDLGIRENIVFHGHIAEEEALYRIYSNSIFSISPGYVGLSITQSLGFGVPMLISKHENHSPEIECAQENFNCIFFDSFIEDDISEKMNYAWENKHYWIEKSHSISNNCAENYSAESMCNSIIEALNE